MFEFDGVFGLEFGFDVGLEVEAVGGAMTGTDVRWSRRRQRKGKGRGRQGRTGEMGVTRVTGRVCDGFVSV